MSRTFKNPYEMASDPVETEVCYKPPNLYMPPAFDDKIEESKSPTL